MLFCGYIRYLSYKIKNIPLKNDKYIVTKKHYSIFFVGLLGISIGYELELILWN